MRGLSSRLIEWSLYLGTGVVFTVTSFGWFLRLADTVDAGNVYAYSASWAMGHVLGSIISTGFVGMYVHVR